MQLPLQQQRVDHRADIIDDDVAEQFRGPRLGVDLHFRDMAAIGEGAVLRAGDKRGPETELGAIGQRAGGVAGPRQRLDPDAAIGARHAKDAVGEFDIPRCCFQQMRRDLSPAGDHLLRRADQRATGSHHGA